MSVTHVAGPVVGYQGRGIQRCPVCGEKLIDTKGQAAPVGPDGEPPQACFWAEAHLVQVVGNQSSDIGEWISDAPLPEDFCIALVE